jgi:hypothetical protein
MEEVVITLLMRQGADEIREGRRFVCRKSQGTLGDNVTAVRARMAVTAAQNCTAALKGETPNLVNQDVLEQHTSA